MSTAIDRQFEPLKVPFEDALTVAMLCRLLQVGPTAIPVLADAGHIHVVLPPAVPGYCPRLDDVRIVRMRRSLTADQPLLQRLRGHHPLAQLGSHLGRTTALGGILRVLGR